MERRASVAAIAGQLFEAGHFVTYPDHPVLARSPDILATTGSGLVACFIYTSGARKPESNSERVRVLLSRFALPTGTQFILAADRLGNALTDASLQLFDEIVGFNSALGVAFRSPVASGVPAAVDRLRTFQTERFAEAWTGAAPTLGDSALRTTFEFRNTRRDRRTQWIRDEDNRIVASVDADRGRQQLMQKVQTLGVATVVADFGLDRGSLGLEDTSALVGNHDARLAMHEMRTPFRVLRRDKSGDPLKPYRVAAFAGARVDYAEDS